MGSNPTLSANHRSIVSNNLASVVGSQRAMSIFVARCSASNSLKIAPALTTWVPKEPMRHHPPISAHPPLASSIDTVAGSFFGHDETHRPRERSMLEVTPAGSFEPPAHFCGAIGPTHRLDEEFSRHERRHYR